MTFRTRVFLAITVAALIPLGLLAVGVRRELSRRLSVEFDRRAAATLATLQDEIGREDDAIDLRLRALAAALASDNRFRAAAVQGSLAERRELLDLAGGAMRQAGFALLQLQDTAGRILSSGHFRNEFDRIEPVLPRALGATTTPIVVRARTADSAIVVLARADSFRVGGMPLVLVGGTAIAERLRGRLPSDPDLTLELRLPDGASASPQGATDTPVATLALPFLDLLAAGPVLDTARVLVVRPDATLAAVRRTVDRWSLAALAITMALALLAATWLSAWITRPLTALAKQTEAIDLDRLDQRFASERADELGVLARGLAAMTERLRQSTGRLRDVERRAATGDLARQVNHDIKNGLVPIRNVVRHLAQVARDEPAALPGVFEERRGTLETSLVYLDTLARNYARLSPTLAREPCDLNAIAVEVARAAAAERVQLRTALPDHLPPVAADPLVLRRVVENLVSNAVESFGPSPANGAVVTIGAERAGPSLVRLTISDTGPGMDRAALERAFDDFHTTKAGGTGLGLSIVRRLVLDLNGTLRLETAPGQGTRAIVELPVAGDPP